MRGDVLDSSTYTCNSVYTNLYTHSDAHTRTRTHAHTRTHLYFSSITCEGLNFFRYDRFAVLQSKVVNGASHPS